MSGSGAVGSGGTGATGGVGGGAGGGQGGTAGGGGGTSLPPPVWQPSGTPGSWNGVSFVVPNGMVAQESTLGLEMTRDTPEGICVLAITPPQPASGDLAVQANDLMHQIFGAQNATLADEVGGSDLLSYRVHGMSPRGFEYVELTAEVRPGGQPSLHRGRIMLVSLGATVVPIIGLSSDYYGCLHFEYEKNVAGPDTDWASLYYSLGFQGAVPNPGALQPVIVGKWSDFSSGVLNGEIYSPSGRYAGTHTWQTEKDLSPNDITGEGNYAVEGETLARFPDSGGGESNLFRIILRFKPGQSPVEELHQVKVDAVGAYELGLQRVP